MSYDDWKTTEPLDLYDVPADEIIDDEMIADDWSPEDDPNFATWLDDQEAGFLADARCEIEAAADVPAGLH